MKPSNPAGTIRSLARLLECKQAEMAAALLQGNRMFQKPITIGNTALNACIFAARSVHLFPIESYELSACEPFQVAIHTQQGVGVLVWRNFEAVSRDERFDALSDGTTRFVALEECCPDVQYIRRVAIAQARLLELLAIAAAEEIRQSESAHCAAHAIPPVQSLSPTG